MLARNPHAKSATARKIVRTTFHAYDKYQYNANEYGDCSSATKDNSSVINNESGLVVYYDFTVPGKRWVDWRLDPNNYTVWCHIKADKKNVIDFDSDVDDSGIQMRSYYIRPGKFYYFTLNGSSLKLESNESKQLKSVTCGSGPGTCKYEIEP